MRSAGIHPVARVLALSCQRLYQAGFTPGFTAQASVRDEDLCWLTPQNLSFGSIQAESFLPVLPDGQVMGVVAADADEPAEPAEPLTQGALSHWAFHQAIYEARPEVNAILLTRPPQAWLLAHQEALEGELSLPGLSERVLKLAAAPEDCLALARQGFRGYSLILIPETGVLVLGETLERTMGLLEALESAAGLKQNVSRPLEAGRSF